ncbi:ATP-binding protein [Bacillus suaedae]|uniref:histidine kinase n=1 Tax=Halalkalibacter suaedae TaxID=2822140 RepID=A0A941AQC6_9BACI|nr:ATP-binding protein [Bacillus suaedae]MBP3952497.1 response regulator [Bacillus suaedae]
MFSYSARIVLLLCIAFVVFQPDAAGKDARIVIDESINTLNLDQKIEIFEDTESKWTIEDIQSSEMDKHFKQYQTGVPSFGYAGSVYWAKLQLDNQSLEHDWLLEIRNSTLDHITLYSEAGDEFKAQKTGDLLPFSERDMNHRNYVFEIELQTNEAKTMYLRFETEGAMQFPLTLYNHKTFLEKTLYEYGVLGLFIGIAVVMAFYNLFLYFSLRNKSYLFYVLFILVNLITHLAFTGLAYQFIWPESVWWNNRSIVFFMCLTNIVAVLFAKSFLDANTYIPRINILFNYLMLFNLATMVLLFFSYPAALNISVASIACMSIVIMIGAFISLRRGFRPARFFLLSWYVFLTGVIISILADAGMIPLNFFTKYAWQMSTAFELILISFALADKINMLRLEKEQAEQEAIKSQKEKLESLKQNDKLKDEFLAITSHELRTPLNGIIGLADSLYDGAGGEINNTVKDNLKMIKISGIRLAHLIDDILDFSKLKHNDIQLHLKKVRLKEVSDVVVTICETLLKQKDIKLINRISPDLTVLADENRLQQILFNLIGNGIKYTEKGEVVISAREIKDKVIIEVKDTGIGIPEEEHQSIFLPFNRGNQFSASTSRGSGIGLNITKRLIELQQGEITLQSTVGEGTSFYFTLPLYQEAERAEPEIASTVSVVSREYHEQTSLSLEMPSTDVAVNGGSRILVADDDPVNIQVLINYLSMAGYTIETASDGEEVLSKISQNDSFSLLILDIMMPKMSGYEVCQTLRETITLTELPILMLTAKNQIEDRITAFEVGANDYLMKPVDKRELLSRTKTLINLKESTLKVQRHAEEVARINQQLLEMNDLLEEKVTSRTKQLEWKNQELDKINLELRQIEQSRIDLLSNISHELGTPLTFLQGYIQTVQEGFIEASNPKYLELAQEKITLLDRLISDLYDLIKFESGKMQLKIRTIPFTSWFNHLFEKFEFEVNRNGCLIHKPVFKNVLDNDGELLIDVDRIDQVMTNIIYNALKHLSKEGEIFIFGELVHHQEDENGFETKVKIEVRDNGTGIAEEEIPFLFNRFYRGSDQNSDEIKGSGLGLAITKEIIEYHKGHIWIESKKGEGTSVFFTLPIIL